MTTLELTALTYAVIMIATSILWYHKPCIITPTVLHLKADKTVQEVRLWAKENVSAPLFFGLIVV